jgi:phosphoglycerate kinase
VILLENLRFHPEEEENDPDFARQLAGLGDLYVNDAFGAAHRAHASTEGVTHFFDEAISGYLMKRELQYLQDAIADPQRPFVAILGGAKVPDKIEVIRNLMTKVDTLLIGGGMSYTFLKARGLEIGDSLFDPESVAVAGELLSQAESSGVELLLPVDLVVAGRIAAGVDTEVVAAAAIPEGLQGLDVGPETSSLFEDRASKAGTVVWNGPLGVFEVEPFANATLSMARCLERAGWESGAVTIIGGGDTAAAVAKAGVADRMTHVSTGGGASLECLAGLELPGAAALSDG